MRPRSVRRILDKYARFIRLGEAEAARLHHSVGLFQLEHARQLAQEESDKAARLALRAAAGSPRGGTAAPLTRTHLRSASHF